MATISDYNGVGPRAAPTQVTFTAGNGATVSIPISQSSTMSSAATATVTATASSSSGLSSGAKIGIGLGVPLGLIAFAMVAVLVFRYRRNAKVPVLSRLSEDKKISEDSERQMNSVEICDEFEKQDEGVQEVHGANVPAYSTELPASQGIPRQELPA